MSILLHFNETRAQEHSRDIILIFSDTLQRRVLQTVNSN